MSSSDHFQHIPRTRDGALNWAADTDPIGPVTPELALVDPRLSRGKIDNEVTMSSMQFGDVHAPLEGQPVVPLQPLQPLQPLVPSAPVPSAPPAPGVPVTDMRDVPLGTLVFRAGLLPEERLEEALQEGMKTGKRLGEILLERAWVSETDLGRLLAGQKGLPFVELDPAAIDPTAPPLLHPEKARLHGALPIGFEGGVPVVAVADPSNDLVVENVRRALACEPVLVVAGRDALVRAINQVYGVEATAAEPQPVVPVVEPPAAPIVEPQAAPVVEVQPQPVVEQFAPVAPVVAEPVVPVAPPPVAEPSEPEPPQIGEGLWLGQPQEAVAPPVAPPEAEPVVEPTLGQGVDLNWTVVLRLADGERLEVGSFPGEADAVEGARAVVAQIAANGSWPFFAGRFIRPEAIVSVDLVELEVSRWLGSQARAAAWSAQQPTA